MALNSLDRAELELLRLPPGYIIQYRGALYELAAPEIHRDENGLGYRSAYLLGSDKTTTTLIPSYPLPTLHPLLRRIERYPG